MKVYRDLSSDENRKFWSSVDAAADRVSRWPDWKRGDKAEDTPLQHRTSKKETNEQNKREKG